MTANRSDIRIANNLIAAAVASGVTPASLRRDVAALRCVDGWAVALRAGHADLAAAFSTEQLRAIYAAARREALAVGVNAAEIAEIAEQRAAFGKCPLFAANVVADLLTLLERNCTTFANHFDGMAYGEAGQLDSELFVAARDRAPLLRALAAA